MTESTPIQPADLSPTVREYLAASSARDSETAIRSFTPDAVVVDDGRTYRGTAEILGFLQDAGAEFSYTTELTGGRRIDDQHWVAVNHLEGDFPGGVADLAYRFVLAGDRIAELVIAP